MFYNVFLDLCIKKGVTPSKVTEEIGVSRRAATGWKDGAMPHDITLQKLAKYFGVSASYFLGEKSSADIKGAIKLLAKSRGMGLPRLEEELGFGNGTIIKLGKSSPSADKLQKVADYFGVSVDYILGREQPENTELSDDNIKFALFNGDKTITDAQYDEVKRFAQFVKERDRE
ncbi:MAG: helix-turn-helix domain-containing protein [Christensenellaceae bacterium]|jgi:transcriptional regulator with XRE-family HTH domain|nr:helix-turn-helix domain-containing protein [Christensenellaceae bacterium]